MTARRRNVQSGASSTPQHSPSRVGAEAGLGVGAGVGELVGMRVVLQPAHDHGHIAAMVSIPHKSPEGSTHIPSASKS